MEVCKIRLHNELDSHKMARSNLIGRKYREALYISQTKELKGRYTNTVKNKVWGFTKIICIYVLSKNCLFSLNLFKNVEKIF